MIAEELKKYIPIYEHKADDNFGYACPSCRKLIAVFAPLRFYNVAICDECSCHWFAESMYNEVSDKTQCADIIKGYPKRFITIIRDDATGDYVLPVISDSRRLKNKLKEAGCVTRVKGSNDLWLVEEVLGDDPSDTYDLDTVSDILEAVA
jgi:hypothetical protein